MNPTIERLYRHYHGMTADASAAATLVLAHVNADHSEAEESWLSTTQVADKLRASAETIRTLCRDGQLRSVRVGRGYRTKQEWIDDYLHRSGNDTIPTSIQRHGIQTRKESKST